MVVTAIIHVNRMPDWLVMNVGKYTGGGNTTTCWICNRVCSMGLISVASVCVVIAFPMLNYFQHLCHICCFIHLYSGLLSLSVKGAFVSSLQGILKYLHVQKIRDFHLQLYESIRLMEVWYIHNCLFLLYVNQDMKYSSHFQRIAEAYKEIRNEWGQCNITGSPKIFSSAWLILRCKGVLLITTETRKQGFAICISFIAYCYLCFNLVSWAEG
jgi:hypothetical protein